MATRQTAATPADEATAARGPKKNGAEETAPAHEAPEPRESSELETIKRRMPDNLRRYLIRLQGGKFYLPAAYRIVWFRDEMGDDWGIRTTLIEGGHEKGFATVHAEVLNPENRVVASGMKTECKTDFPAGWVEKAESGAIARALAVLGFGTQFMPELDDDGSRPADSPRSMPHSPARPAADGPHVPEREPQVARPPAPVAEVWEGPGQCPRCHAPEGKRHGKPCIG